MSKAARIIVIAIVVVLIAIIGFLAYPTIVTSISRSRNAGVASQTNPAATPTPTIQFKNGKGEEVTLPADQQIRFEGTYLCLTPTPSVTPSPVPSPDQAPLCPNLAIKTPMGTYSLDVTSTALTPLRDLKVNDDVVVIGTLTPTGNQSLFSASGTLGTIKVESITRKAAGASPTATPQ